MGIALMLGFQHRNSSHFGIHTYNRPTYSPLPFAREAGRPTPEPTPAPEVVKKLTKAEWRAKAPSSTPIQFTGQIITGKARLFAAVGPPDKTQTIGDEISLYWQCSDGLIQIVTGAQLYNITGQIIGPVNDY